MLLPGNLVQVLAPSEIFATLDRRGTLEGLPFMPEMLPYCGQRVRVWRRIERTCVEGDSIRRIKNVVFLEGPRCDGQAHDGCDRDCRFFWHEAWLRTAEEPPSQDASQLPEPKCAFPYSTKVNATHYLCQSTELLRATGRLSKLDLRQFYRDWRARTYSSKQFLRVLALPFWIRLKVLLCGMTVVRVHGILRQTPTESLNLQPGDWVEVKSRDEIARTLDRHGRNRGLEFSRLMLPFCGRRLKVRKRVQQIILETTGEMRQIQNTVILEDCTCDGHAKWGGCPRDIAHLWREIWLRKIAGP